MDNAISLQVAEVEPAETAGSDSDGDLWPSAWADDSHLYSACGDGAGFGPGGWSDVVVNRISGTPKAGLTGQRLAAGDQICPIWGDPARYNRKPTGMIAVPACGLGHDRLVLAVQELGFGEGDHAFNHSPTASLATSDDYGQSWECEEPAFTGGIFTTIMFLDFGQSQSQAESFARICPQANGEFGYAFGLDHCWRSSYTQFVQDPDKLHLARFPLHHATELRAWEFFAGGSDAERPQWSKSIRDRKPVLVDKRRIFVGDMAKGGYASPISQGGVVWIEPLRCLVYSSWTEFTFEFYCSPTPWGPWALFGSFHFGEYPWRGPGSAKPWHGGYATSLPSKFLDADGLGGYLQSNWFVRSGESEGNSYRFSLRHIRFSERKHE